MKTVIFSDQMEQPYGEWLTECLHELGRRNLKSVAIAAIDGENEDTITGYWHCSVYDKTLMAGAIQSDVMMKVVKANITSILESAEDEDDESGAVDREE